MLIVPSVAARRRKERDESSRTDGHVPRRRGRRLATRLVGRSSAVPICLKRARQYGDRRARPVELQSPHTWDSDRVPGCAVILTALGVLILVGISARPAAGSTASDGRYRLPARGCRG